MIKSLVLKPRVADRSLSNLRTESLNSPMNFPYFWWYENSVYATKATTNTKELNSTWQTSIYRTNSSTQPVNQILYVASLNWFQKDKMHSPQNEKAKLQWSNKLSIDSPLHLHEQHQSTSVILLFLRLSFVKIFPHAAALPPTPLTLTKTHTKLPTLVWCYYVNLV